MTKIIGQIERIDSFDDVALFTDIHFGINKDNQMFLNESAKFIDWLISDINSKNIKHIIFVGDYYHNRSSINLQSLQAGYDNLKKLTKYAKVYLIIGNHDAFYKESVEISSVKVFADIDELQLIDRPTVIKTQNRNLLLCPFNAKIDEINTFSNLDVIIGHFELTGVQLAGNQVMFNANMSMSELTDKCPLVFTGHSHIQKEYSTSNGKVISIGSPFELDWGDKDNPKGYYVLNMPARTYTFIQNPSYPKHISIKLSEILKDDVQISPDSIKDNIVRLTIDVKHDFAGTIAMIKKLNDMAPIGKCEVEYVYEGVSHVVLEKSDIEEVDKSTLSHLDYMKKYISKLAEENPADEIDVKYLYELSENFYNKVKIANE